MQNEQTIKFSHSRHEHPSQNAFFKHIHEDYELLYFMEGDAEYVVESAVYRLQKGDLLLIKPGDYHFLRLLSQNPYERFVVNFSSSDFPPFIDEFLCSADVLYALPKESLVHSLFLEWKEKEKEKAFTREQTLFLVRNILGYVLSVLPTAKKAESVQPTPLHDTLQEVLAFLEREPTTRLTVSELAEKFFVSPSWIAHTFKKELGISLSQYVGKKRMLYAKKLIQGGHTPTQAANECHFLEYSTFYRQYKKHLGVSPKQDAKR